MNYVTFRIEETVEGEFVLFLHNHSLREVHEQIRSRNLDEVVAKLKDQMEYRRRFMNALGNHAPVMGIAEKLKAERSGTQDRPFPRNWTDPLELYGEYRRELEVRGADLDEERAELRVILDRHGPEYVWNSRRRLVAERLFLKDF